MPPDVTRFLDDLADAVGLNRLREFVDTAAAYPPHADPADLPEEARDMIAEMHRLRSPTEVRDMLAYFRTGGDTVLAYLDQRG